MKQIRLLCHKTLKYFLDKNKVKYVTINYLPAYTVQEIKAMDAKKVELANEYEFQKQFPGCKLRANMPPFGNLFDMGCICFRRTKR